MDLRLGLYYLTLFLTPFFTVSPWQNLLGVPVGVIFGLLIVLLALCYWRELLLSVKNFPAWGFSAWAVIIFLLVCAASLGSLLILGQAMRENHIRLMYLIFSGVVCWLNTIIPVSKNVLRKGISIYITAAIIASAYGVYVTVGFMFGLHTGQEVTWTVPRLFGTATEPQVFANFLLSVIPLSIALYILRSREVYGKMMLIGIWLFTLALLMTFSAGAWAGAAAGMVPLLLIFKEIKLKNLLFLAGVFSLVWVSVLAINQWGSPGYLKGFDSISVKFKIHSPATSAPAESQTKKENIYSLSMVSVNEREWYREAAWKMFKTHPVFGVGLGNYGYLYNEYRPAAAPKVEYYARAHNQYLEILAEMGVVGFAAFLFVLLSLFAIVWKVLKKGKNNSLRIYTVGLFASLAAMGVQGYSLGILLHNYIWVVLGLTYAASRLSADVYPERRPYEHRS